MRSPGQDPFVPRDERETAVRIVLLLLVVTPFAHLRAEDALHVRVDRLVAAAADGPVAERSTAATFLRRATLDLLGRIPTADEVRAFLADDSADKRTALIDRWLAHDEHPRHMRDVFHVMLLERRDGQEDWDRWLEASFRENAPWDRMVAEILRPYDDENEATRGAQYFVTKRLEKYGQNPTDYPGLTRDVGRLFLGVDLACAQCHDHPLVDDYRQVDFQGLFVVFDGTTARKDVEWPSVGERLVEKPLEFVSVLSGETGATGPRLPFGMEVEVPTLKKEEQYLVEPDKKKRTAGVPTFSPLRTLSEQLPRRETALFRRNAANRVWAQVMGRGLVEPLDLAHAANPASHPELLTLLADELAAHDFDLKWLRRELMLTETYQRSSRMPEGADAAAEDRFVVAIERSLTPEQLMRSVLLATGEGDRLPDDATAREERLAEIRTAFTDAFANPAGEAEPVLNPTLRGALFLANSDMVHGWLQPAEGNLVDRVSRIDDDGRAVDELYVHILGRRPTEAESTDMTAYLADHGDERPAAVSRVAWALLASTEFALDH